MVVAPAAPKLSLQCEAIATGTTTIRSLDWDHWRFDIEFGLRNGTTYNAFLVRGERTALIDTSHAKFRTWVPCSRVIDPTAIDVLIVSHTEPDHSSLIGDLIDRRDRNRARRCAAVPRTGAAGRSNPVR